MDGKDVFTLIAGRLKEFRQAKGMTQSDLSSKADMDDGNYRKYESGRKKINIENLRKLSEALDVPIADFFLSDSELYVIRRMRQLPDVTPTSIDQIIGVPNKTVEHAEKVGKEKLS